MRSKFVQSKRKEHLQPKWKTKQKTKPYHKAKYGYDESGKLFKFVPIKLEDGTIAYGVEYENEEETLEISL